MGCPFCILFVARLTFLVQVNYLKASRIIASITNKYSPEMEQFEGADARSRVQEKADDEVYQLLLAADLRQEAFLFQRGREFAKDEQQLRKVIENETMPARRWTWKRYSWSPKNWIITKETQKGEAPVYRAQKYRTAVTTSDAFGYRFAHIYYFMRFTFSAGVGGCLWNMLSGPVGLRALFSPSSYYSKKTVDPDSGKIIDDPSSLTLSYVSRIASIWKNVRESREVFERERDTGLIGKGIGRIYNVAWNLVKGVLGTATVLLSQPILTLVNVLASISVIACAFIWAPVTAISRYFVSVFFYDYDYAGRADETAFLPLARVLIWRLGVLGIGNLLSAPLLALLYHPGAALLQSSYASVSAGLRYVYDFVMFGVVKLARPRVPASNGFLAKRISGPGIASQLFCTASVADAMMAVEATLERLLVNLFYERLVEAARIPIMNLRKGQLQSILNPLAAGVQADRKIFDPIHKSVAEIHVRLENTHLKRQRDLPSIPSGAQVRFTRDQLSSLQEAVTKVAKVWYFEKIIPIHSTTQLEALWSTSWSLEREDWSSLAKYLLKETFGPHIMQPLEETEPTITLEFEKFSFADLAISGASVDPLEAVVPHHQKTILALSPIIPRVSASELLHPSAAGRSAFISPLSDGKKYSQVV